MVENRQDRYAGIKTIRSTQFESNRRYIDDDIEVRRRGSDVWFVRADEQQPQTLPPSNCFNSYKSVITYKP